MVDAVLERLPELLQQRHPFLLAARHRVELVFQAGGEVVVDVLGEIVGQELVDHAADVGREEALLVQLDVLAVLQRRDDGGVGRGPADAVFLQRLDQAGLGVARRRLGEVLLGADLVQRRRFSPSASGGSMLSRRRRRLGVVRAFLVDRHEARLGNGRAGGAEHVAASPAAEVDGDRVDGRVHHLAGDGALPDQFVELELVLVEVALSDLPACAQRRRRADRLVRLLGVLRLGLVGARRRPAACRRRSVVAMKLADLGRPPRRPG